MSEPRTATGETAACWPENRCERCGRSNVVWFAPSDIWNRAVGSPNGILCPMCFLFLAEKAGIPSPWCLAPTDADGKVEQMVSITAMRELWTALQTLHGACYKRDVSPIVGWDVEDARRDYIAAKADAIAIINRYAGKWGLCP